MERSDRPIIKICGIRHAAHALAVADAGADLIGFVFAPSKRQVRAEEARPVVEAIGESAVPVGLFVDEPVETIRTVSDASGVRLLQIHWRTDERDLETLPLPYLLVRRTEPGARYDSVAADVDRVFRSSNPPLAILIDSFHPRASGGTGTLADWSLAAKLATVFPVMLAGGLTPENVSDAIEQVRPIGVDVSSGVEIDGVKSDERIRQFVANARAAFERYSASSSSRSERHS